MGMFDEIRCDAPLPDGYDATDVGFQSKFPDCCMCRYRITRDGRLLDAADNDLEPEGYLNFYTTDPPQDVSADRDARWREYRAHFVAGELESIVGVAKDEPETRYYGLASFRWFNPPSFMFGDPFADDEAASDSSDSES